MAPILGYWSIRGISEQIRLLLHYLGVEYKEQFYHFGPQFSREEWLAEKFNVGLDFPNLPYYIDGDFKLTQSAAIIEYIADQHDMLPACKKRRAELHMLHNDIMDFRVNVQKMVYFSPSDDEKKEFLKAILPDKLKQYENYLGANQWLTGDKINYPDFNLCEILEQVKKLEATCLNKLPKLTAYLSRFESMPELKGYLTSSEFKNRK
ncbi:hypothetical protein Aperf_G00000056726 [Anoplocephala perfoliata]